MTKMNRLKVINVDDAGITFENGITLTSYHESDCCEEHYLSFNDLSLLDFRGLEFDLTTDKFFNRVPGYGIELLPIHGHPIRIPGYGENNGYYSADLTLRLYSSNFPLEKEFDISECQVIN